MSPDPVTVPPWVSEMPAPDPVITPTLVIDNVPTLLPPSRIPAPVPVSLMLMPLMVLPEPSVTAVPADTEKVELVDDRPTELPLTCVRLEPSPSSCSPLASVMPLPAE